MQNRKGRRVHLVAIAMLAVAVGVAVYLVASSGAHSSSSSNTPETAVNAQAHTVLVPLREVSSATAPFFVSVHGQMQGERCYLAALTPAGRLEPLTVGPAKFEFHERPPKGTQLIAWSTSVGKPGRVSSVSDWSELPSAGNEVSLMLGRTWNVTVTLEGVESGIPSPELGVRFGSAVEAEQWIRRVEFLTGQSVREFLFLPEASGQYRLPLLPSRAALRVSAAAGRLFAESPEFKLDEDRELKLSLTELPNVRRIRVRDGAGAPVAVDLSIVEEMSETSRPDSRRHQVVTTNDDGMVEVPTWAKSTLLIKLMSENWIASSRSLSMPPEELTLDIAVWRAVSLRIRAQYDDGQPYLGPFSVQGTFPDGQSWGTSGRFVGDAASAQDDEAGLYLFHEVAELRGLPMALPLQVVLEQVRVEYPLYRKDIEAYEVSDGREFLFVIPKGSTKSTRSRIRIGGVVPTNGGLVVQVFRLSDGQWVPADEFRLEESLESGLLASGRYVIRLIGNSAWQSPEFELAAGATKEVNPSFQQPASVRARTLDAMGNPISGAVLDVASSAAPLYSKDEAGLEPALTNDGGFTELGGQPQGRTTFRLESPGFQPELREVELSAGQVLDLGDIVLTRALGHIVINLPEADYGQVQVSVRVLSPFTGALCSSAVAAGSTVSIDGLATGRTYTVVVKAGAGGSQKSFNTIRLTEQRPSAELDATDLKIR